MTTTPTPTATKKAAPKKISNDLVANNPFVEFVKLYKHNPVLFVREVLNTEPDQWQIEFLNHIANGNRRISVRSGHGVGKSTAASWAMIWYLFLRFPVKVVVTAPTSSQLYDGKKGITVIPCAYIRQYIEWAPRGSGSGAPIHIYPATSDILSRTHREPGENKDLEVVVSLLEQRLPWLMVLSKILKMFKSVMS